MEPIIHVDHLTKRYKKSATAAVDDISFVLHSPWLDLAVTIGFFLVFTIVGTYLFVRADRNR